jgi:hypothetical protein
MLVLCCALLKHTFSFDAVVGIALSEPIAGDHSLRE